MSSCWEVCKEWWRHTTAVMMTASSTSTVSTRGESDAAGTNTRTRWGPGERLRRAQGDGGKKGEAGEGNHLERLVDRMDEKVRGRLVLEMVARGAEVVTECTQCSEKKQETVVKKKRRLLGDSVLLFPIMSLYTIVLRVVGTGAGAMMCSDAAPSPSPQGGVGRAHMREVVIYLRPVMRFENKCFRQPVFRTFC